ncbi:hypothetical protein C8R42DRAFT_699428 [Lentinula raphanica]|nr:hypothetical protein C8R42DRAFT_699428 [Lentinula raphanica]
MSQPSAQMATQNLCDYCHVKPRFGQYNYCSKTCAAQAPSRNNSNAKSATSTVKPRAPAANNNLCDFCKQVPKHPGYDYCGKSCAQSAKNGTSTQSTKSAQTGTSVPTKPSKAATHPIVQAAAALAGNTPGTIDPTQIANLVVQQLQNLIPPTSSAYPANTNHNTSKAGFPNLKQQYPPTTKFSGNSQPALRVQTPQFEPEEPGECLIPGCGQPVYVDAKGTKTSAYCSMRHRQEAVDSGLASPCIFCLQLPQSETDYFCSKECREESLNKERYEVVDE